MKKKTVKRVLMSFIHLLTQALHIYTYTRCLFNPLAWTYKSLCSRCFCVTRSLFSIDFLSCHSLSLLSSSDLLWGLTCWFLIRTKQKGWESLIKITYIYTHIEYWQWSSILCVCVIWLHHFLQKKEWRRQKRASTQSFLSFFYDYLMNGQRQ